MEKIHSVLFGTATIRQYLKYLTKINDIDTYKKMINSVHDPPLILLSLSTSAVSYHRNNIIVIRILYCMLNTNCIHGPFHDSKVLKQYAPKKPQTNNSITDRVNIEHYPSKKYFHDMTSGNQKCFHHFGRHFQ